MEQRHILSPIQVEALVERLSASLSAEPGLAAAWLHGSLLRGEPARDVDLAVLATPGEDAWRVADRLARRLDAEVPVGLDYDVRPVDETAPAAFRYGLVAHGRLLAEGDSDCRILFEADAARDWLDIRPWLERSRKAYLEGLSDDG